MPSLPFLEDYHAVDSNYGVLLHLVKLFSQNSDSALTYSIVQLGHEKSQMLLVELEAKYSTLGTTSDLGIL